jgi:hypothetical protein
MFRRIAVIPGDGIGSDVTTEAVKVFEMRRTTSNAALSRLFVKTRPLQIWVARLERPRLAAGSVRGRESDKLRMF